VLSVATLVVVHGHVFLPVVVEHFSGEPLLLFVRECVQLLLLEKLFVFLLEADAHVVFISLAVLFGEAETVKNGFGLSQDRLHFIWSALLHLEQSLLESLVEVDFGHLLHDGFAAHVLCKSTLQTHLVYHTFEREGFVHSQIRQNLTVQLNVGLLHEGVRKARIGQSVLTSRSRDGLDPFAPVVASPSATVPVSELLSAEDFADGDAEAVLAAPAEALGERKDFLATPVSHTSP